MNLGTKITIYKFTPQVFTLTQYVQFYKATTILRNTSIYNPIRKNVAAVYNKQNLI